MIMKKDGSEVKMSDEVRLTRIAIKTSLYKACAHGLSDKTVEK
jgi:hypothetical protein